MTENMQTYQSPDPAANQPSTADLAEKMLYAEMERHRPKFRLSFEAPGFDLNVAAAQVGNLAPFLNIIAKSVLDMPSTGEAEPQVEAEQPQQPQQEVKTAAPAPAAPAQEKPKRTRKSEQAPEIPPPAPAPQYEREPEPEAPAAPAPIAAPPAAPAPAPALDRTEVANVFLEYSTKVGMENAKKLLAVFNAPKFRDILDSQLPEFHQRLVAAMEMVG